MALFDTVWYTGSVQHAAVTARPSSAAVAAGVIRRQTFTPAVGSERCFVCIVAGTTSTTDPTGLTRGAKSTDGTATWQECTGQPAVNGDFASTATWAQVKAATPAVLGQIIKRSSGTSYQICTTAGAMSASEPAFSDTAGVTTTDTTAVWTSLGAVGSFTAWGAPHARLANAYAANWGAAGNKFWVADNHAETQATSITLTGPGTAAVPTYAVCVDRTAALPPVAANYNTGASITSTVAAVQAINFSGSGVAYYEGIAFVAGTGSSITTIWWTTSLNFAIHKNCSFKLNTTSALAGTSFDIGDTTDVCAVVWDNCSVAFGATAQSIKLQAASLEWRNTATPIVGAIMPTNLFRPSVANNPPLICRGVDFSAFSGQLLTSNTSNTGTLVFEDCKFNASMTRYGASATGGYATTAVIAARCDSGATNYKSTRDEYSGAQSTETTIVRTGGATDGVTPISTKLVTNAQAALLTPLRMLRLAAMNNTTGADRTVTVCGTINSGTLPNNDEIWMEVQYLGNAGAPLASFKSTGKSHPLATASAVASDGSTWGGGGSGAGWSPFKLVATLTSPQPQMKGYVYAAIRAAKPNTTYYLDPKVTLT